RPQRPKSASRAESIHVRNETSYISSKQCGLKRGLCRKPFAASSGYRQILAREICNAMYYRYRRIVSLYEGFRAIGTINRFSLKGNRLHIIAIRSRLFLIHGGKP